MIRGRYQTGTLFLYDVVRYSDHSISAKLIILQCLPKKTHTKGIFYRFVAKHFTTILSFLCGQLEAYQLCRGDAGLRHDPLRQKPHKHRHECHCKYISTAFNPSVQYIYITGHTQQCQKQSVPHLANKICLSESK